MRLIALACYALVEVGVATAARSERDCLADFRSCEGTCSTVAGSQFAMHQSAPYDVRVRLCVKTCARASALCQQQEGEQVEHHARSATDAGSNNKWTSFTDALGQPTLPFGFYQYAIHDARNFGLPEEEAVHGMSLSAPYVSTAAPSEQWYADMEVRLAEHESTSTPPYQTSLHPTPYRRSWTAATR